MTFRYRLNSDILLYRCFRARLLTMAVAFICLLASPGKMHAQMQAGQVDIFMGVDFNYRDIFHNGRVFDLLINLTPGVKWNMGHRWEAAAQVYIPVLNQFGERYKRVRLNMAVLSKQLALWNRLKLKISAGLFGNERYGLDLKAQLLFNRWLALSSEIGYTGYCSMAAGWEASKIDRLTALLGPEVYLAPWQTQFVVRGGRFVFGDYGGIAEVFRHFKHVSVGLYVQYSSKAKENFGFKIVAMLPPYKRPARRRVNFRPASNFRITYNNHANEYANRTYFTDPEQNERSGWFDRDLLPWGPETIASDFTYREKKLRENSDSVKMMPVEQVEIIEVETIEAPTPSR